MAETFHEIHLERKPKKSLFHLGRIFVSSTVLQFLDEVGVEPTNLLHRHVIGDWGIFGEYCDIQLSFEEASGEVWLIEDIGKQNVWNVRNDGVEFRSCYALQEQTFVWVITVGMESGNETVFALEERRRRTNTPKIP